ncbi:MAG TPA: hypothetical protein VGY56_08695 [Verrucomicrobiae bacterium]|nr:hypothetical protein [Verrucomicrobiae bacterium]
MSAFAAFLETDRMYFREFREADAQLLFRYDADMLHGWVEQERRAVKYSITRVEHLRSRRNETN